MVPTDEEIELKACSRRDVQSIGLTAFREDAGRNVSDGQRFDCLADRMNRGLRSVEAFEDFLGRVGGSLVDLGQDNIGDHALAANAIEKTQQPMNNLLSITRLTWGEASPDARFEIKRWRRHGVLLPNRFDQKTCRVVLGRKPRRGRRSSQAMLSST
jgi:hypothetical protein